jgi:hypothetical protein
MTKFVAYEKMSKKERKKIDAIKRRDWNGVHPSTKTIQGKKNVHIRKPKHPESIYE